MVVLLMVEQRSWRSLQVATDLEITDNIVPVYPTIFPSEHKLAV